MKNSKLVKVNIGSGPIGKSDWINLDWGILPFLNRHSWLRTILVTIRILPESYNTLWPSNAKLHDCRKKLPFNNKSIDFIYTSHFIEHLYRYQSINLLRECRRVLKAKGILRVSVPDLENLIKKYINKDKKFFNQLNNNELSSGKLKTYSDLFVLNFFGHDSWTEPSLIQKIQRIFIRGHLWMYDYESIKKILNEAGFTKINRYTASKGKVPDIEYLDIHKECSLFIEAS